LPQILEIDLMVLLLMVLMAPLLLQATVHQFQLK
jgi:hypothetical protein